MFDGEGPFLTPAALAVALADDNHEVLCVVLGRKGPGIRRGSALGESIVRFSPDGPGSSFCARCGPITEANVETPSLRRAWVRVRLAAGGGLGPGGLVSGLAGSAPARAHTLP